MCSQKVFVLPETETGSKNKIMIHCLKHPKHCELLTQCFILLDDIFIEKLINLDVKILNVTNSCLLFLIFLFFLTFILGDSVNFLLSHSLFLSADGRGGPYKGLWEAFRCFMSLAVLPETFEVKCWCDSL